VPVPPLAAAAGGPTSPEPRVQSPPCRRREVEDDDRRLSPCDSLSVSLWVTDVRARLNQGSHVSVMNGRDGVSVRVRLAISVRVGFILGLNFNLC
jgi:hypothetical protein